MAFEREGGAGQAAEGVSDETIVEAVTALNARPSTGGTLTPPGEQKTGGPPPAAYKHLKRTHPTYDPGYWAELRALYQGGKELLRNKRLLRELFPRHRGEHDEIYRERQQRAFYIPYAGEIIGHLVSGLKGDPLKMELGGQGQDEPLPEFYQGFVEDVSAQGGTKMSINELIGTQILTALQTECAWTLVELPPPGEYGSAKEQEKAGALNAYAVPLEPETVIDWEEDGAGDFYWVITRVVEAKRMSLIDTREVVTDRWMLYTRQMWSRFEIRRPVDQEPQDETVIPLVAFGFHSFEKVPIVRLKMPPGFWAMDKMAGAAREHFNKRSALAWAEFQHAMQELYEFLAPEEGGKGVTIGANQEDPGRAVNQRRGQGYVQVRGKDDKVAFVGPNPASFADLRASCAELRDDLHRVMHQMALSAANTASALTRSAESKEQDHAAVEVVLAELGAQARKHAAAVLDMVSRGRREDTLVGEWEAKGMAKFTAAAVSDAIEQALNIDMLKIQSATFQRVHRKKLVRQILPEATPEQIEAMETELEENITDEGMEQASRLAIGGGEEEDENEKQPKPGASLKAGGGQPKRGRAA